MTEETETNAPEEPVEPLALKVERPYSPQKPLVRVIIEPDPDGVILPAKLEPIPEPEPKPIDIWIKPDLAVSRDTKGRFKPGIRHGPGDKNAGRARKMRDKLCASLAKPRRWNKVVNALICQCEEGNIEALKLAMSYTMGKPPEKIDMNVQSQNLNVTGLLNQDASERLAEIIAARKNEADTDM